MDDFGCLSSSTWCSQRGGQLRAGLDSRRVKRAAADSSVARAEALALYVELQHHHESAMVDTTTVKHLATKVLRAVNPPLTKQDWVTPATAAAALTALGMWCANGGGVGRPPIGGRITVSLGDDLLERVEAYRSANGLTLSSAVRHLIEEGLTAARPTPPA